MKSNIRLGIVGNSSQVRRYYLEHLRNRDDLPCEVSVAWVSGCLCSDGNEIESCPFRTPNVPAGLRLCFDPDNAYPCNAADNFMSWKRHLADNSVDAILVSLPNQLHSTPVAEFLKTGVAVAVDKPPVVTSAEAMSLVQLAEKHKLTFVTLAQRRFEEVYQKMAHRIRSGDMGQIQLINLLFVHGWTPQRPNWRSKHSLAGGGVLIDSIFNCLDVILRWTPKTGPQVKIDFRWSASEKKADYESKTQTA